MPESPEVTGIYKCSCGNTERFTGIDSHGYGGPDACYSDTCSEEECLCETELAQDFDVTGEYDGTTNLNDSIDYHCFTGGEYDSEIGSYNRILCRDCQAVVWEEPANA